MDGWLALTSPCLDKVSGILLLVNLRHYHRHHVQFTPVLEGRLVHLRLEGEPSTDVLVGYQHLYASSKAAPGAEGLEQSLIKRNEWWTKLHQTLSRFPSRNLVLVVGDFNTDLFPDAPFVGQGTRARLSRIPPDQPKFQQLLQTFSLQALKTFGRADQQAQTFLPAVGARGTQIDFALARRSAADGPARCTRPTWLPFVETSGLRHLPLVGSLPQPKPPRGRTVRSAATRNASVRQAIRLDPELAARFCASARLALVEATPATVSDILLRTWRSCAKTDDPGDPLNTRQEGQALREYFEILYKSGSPEPQPPGNFHVPFTCDELASVLMQLSSGKAVPPWLDSLTTLVSCGWKRS
eukprot:s2604_g6.t1